MNETFETPNEEIKRPRVTPHDVARAARSIVLTQEQAPLSIEPQPGDEIERNGEKFVLIPLTYYRRIWKDGQRTFEEVPYTYRQYYSHTFYVDGGDSGDMEPGPGWDGRRHLRDPENTQKRHNRQFSDEQIKDLPLNLPDDILLFVEPEDSFAVKEWREKQEQAELSS